MSNIIPTSSSDVEILDEIGRRLEALRENRRLSRSRAAELSGISRRTLYSTEHGENPTLLTVIRLLRTYGRLSSLDAFIPTQEISPMEIIEAAERGGRG